MNIAFFSTKSWVVDSFDRAAKGADHRFTYLETRLDASTVALAHDHDAVCVFVNDTIDAEVVDRLTELNVKTIALRCAGFNNVDIRRAHERGITVVRVPAYSPYAVAEHAIGTILALNRRYHRAYNRIREGNFSLDGLLGFDIHDKTVGVIGTGKIGQIFSQIVSGFGCRVLAHDKYPNEQLAAAGVEYVTLQDLYEQADIISLHCPLTHETYHLINEYAIKSMRQGVMIINTSRGPLIDSNAVIAGLKSGRIGYLGLDVYEEEGDLFFEDLSDQVIQDDTFVRLQTFPNVLITAHQGFFTREAIDNIAETTLQNLSDIATSGQSRNAVLPEHVRGA